MKYNNEASNWIDITQTLHTGIAHWPSDIPFSYEITYSKEQTGSVNIGHMKTSLHTGTHVDAPLHFTSKGEGVDQLDINVFIGPAKVIDMSAHSKINRAALIQHNFDGFRRLLIKTSIANQPEKFPKEIPYITLDGAKLLKEKGVLLVGVDVPSVDPLDSKDMAGHHALYEGGIHILENVMLDNVQPGDYELIALPLKLKGADGSPVRAVIRPL